MKKHPKMLWAIVAVIGICLFALVACAPEVEKVLSAPVISLDEATRTITWEKVENADRYEIFENENGIATVEENSYTILQNEAGTYTYTVVAKSDSEDFKDSEASNAVEFTIASAPTEIELSLGESKKVTIPEEGEATVKFNVPKGKYEVYIERLPVLGRDDVTLSFGEDLVLDFADNNNFSEVVDLTETSEGKLMHSGNTAIEVTIGVRKVPTSYVVEYETPTFIRILEDARFDVTFNVPEQGEYEIYVDEVAPALGRSHISVEFDSESITLEAGNGFGDIISLGGSATAKVSIGDGFEMGFYIIVSEPRTEFNVDLDDEAFVRILEGGKAKVNFRNIPENTGNAESYEIYVVATPSVKNEVISVALSETDIYNLEEGNNFSAVISLTGNVSAEVTTESGEVLGLTMGLRKPSDSFELALDETAFVRIMEGKKVTGKFDVEQGSYEVYVLASAVIGRSELVLDFGENDIRTLDNSNNFGCVVELSAGSEVKVSCKNTEGDVIFVIGVREVQTEYEVALGSEEFIRIPDGGTVNVKLELPTVTEGEPELYELSVPNILASIGRSQIVFKVGEEVIATLDNSNNFSAILEGLSGEINVVVSCNAEGGAGFYLLLNEPQTNFVTELGKETFVRVLAGEEATLSISAESAGEQSIELSGNILTGEGTVTVTIGTAVVELNAANEFKGTVSLKAGINEIKISYSVETICDMLITIGSLSE